MAERFFGREGLARELGISARRVQYYVAEGVIPKAHGRTRAAWYDETHVQAIKDHMARQRAARDRPYRRIGMTG